MKKQLLIVLLIFSLLLSGCQLAREGEGGEAAHDRMIGVFITEDHLDLFDFEAYFNDHAKDLMGGGDLMIENPQEYNRRIYANMENGSCVFEDLDGILFASYSFEEEAASGYRNAPCDEIGDGHVTWNETDSGVSLTMEGTVFVSDKIGYVSFFYNPVYQDSDGNVYLTAGSGMSTNVTEGDGTRMGHTLSDEYELTLGSQKQSYTTDIEVSVQVIRLAEKYVLISMREDHTELGREEYAPEELPSSITPAESAAYLLVEAHTTTKDGTQVVTRTIHSPGDETSILDAYIPRENGICVKSTSVIQW